MLMAGIQVSAQKPKKHTFSLGQSEFLLDGQPYQIISGEMHPAQNTGCLLAAADSNGKSDGMQYYFSVCFLELS